MASKLNDRATRRNHGQPRRPDDKAKNERDVPLDIPEPEKYTPGRHSKNFLKSPMASQDTFKPAKHGPSKETNPTEKSAKRSLSYRNNTTREVSPAKLARLTVINHEKCVSTNDETPKRTQKKDVKKDREQVADMEPGGNDGDNVESAQSTSNMDVDNDSEYGKEYEFENSQEMSIEPEDSYVIPKALLDIHPRELEVRNTGCYPTQYFLAQEIVDRISLIIGHPVYSQLRHEDVPKNLSDFSDFDVRIYTARSVNLREQNSSRLCEKELEWLILDGVFDPVRMKEQCDEKVQMYQKTGRVKDDFNSFKKRSEENPKTLFLVIADEAHWGTETASEAKEANANQTYINEWKNDIHGNLFVLQVSATPYSVLSEKRLVDDERYMTLESGEHVLESEKLTSVPSGPLKDLHYVTWAQGTINRLEQGLRTSLKVAKKSSENDPARQVILEVVNDKLVRSQTGHPSELCIQGKHSIVTITHDNKALVLVSDPNGGKLKFIAEDKFNENIVTNQFIVHFDYGEDVFQISTPLHLPGFPSSFQNKLLKYENREIVLGQEYSPSKSILGGRLGVKKTRDLDSFFIIDTCQPAQLVESAPETKRYKSLSYIFNSMRNERKEDQLIRYDDGFADLVAEMKTKLKSKLSIESNHGEFTLAADYSYYVLITESLRHLLKKMRNHKDAYIPKMKLLKWARKYQEERDSNFHGFIPALPLRGATRHVFKAVTEAKFKMSEVGILKKIIYMECPASVGQIAQKGTVNKDTITAQIKAQIKEEQETIICSIYDSLPENIAKKSLLDEYAKCLSDSETLKIVDDLIPDQEAMKDGLQGKMKIIRSSQRAYADIIYTMLSSARLHSGGTKDTYMFEILRDYGKFKVKNINADFDESTFLHRIKHTLQTRVCQYTDKKTRERCPCENLKFNEKNNLICANCSHRHKSIEKYTDLDNLPCILILVDNGRMGDTFPQSFNTMDLRLQFQESGSTLTSVVQQLGRLCRYSDKPNSNMPYALIGKELYDKFQKALDKSPVYYGYTNDYRSLIDTRVTSSGQSKGYQKSEDTEKHHNRILLDAEPQIGKTGVFLEVICLLWKIIKNNISPVKAIEQESVTFSSDEDEEDDIGDEIDDIAAGKEKDDQYWSYPYWRNLKPGKLYDKEATTKVSKYSRIYGPYKYGKKPSNMMPSNPTKNKKKTVGKRTGKYSAMTYQHTCTNCRVEGMNCSERTITVNGQQITISIPNHENYQRVVNVLERKRCVFSTSDTDINSWIFTPTYGRPTTGTLNYCRTMVQANKDPNIRDTPSNYIHVLVVRPLEYDEYCVYWKNTHVILKLPETLSDVEEDVYEGGVGFARRFIQMFSEEFHLDTIFMVDDNVSFFKTAKLIEGTSQVERKDGHLEMEVTPLFHILKHYEQLGSKTKSLPCPPHNFTPHQSSPDGSIQSYTGEMSSFGIVGMMKYQKGSLNVKNPFHTTHVFSVVFVNIKALHERNIKYKAWQVFEDLNINNDVDNAGLHVVKFNRFLMLKRNLKSWYADMCTYKVNQFHIDTELPEAFGWSDRLFHWIRANCRPNQSMIINSAGTEDANVNNLQVREILKNLEQYKKKDSQKGNTLITLNLEAEVTDCVVDRLKAEIEKSKLILLIIRPQEIKRCLAHPDTNEDECLIVSTHNILEFNVPYVILRIERSSKHQVMADKQVSSSSRSVASVSESPNSRNQNLKSQDENSQQIVGTSSINVDNNDGGQIPLEPTQHSQTQNKLNIIETMETLLAENKEIKAENKEMKEALKRVEEKNSKLMAKSIKNESVIARLLTRLETLENTLGTK
ncbi:unnamed protein product [Owenia fusiformis]|uniref:Uncharacterized protein n=1 Tax=Owenia fusiformis TaxID=6347 RepID=A0A8J1XTE6_OWEFU|nr:unnamed protein product [Owenia fusiformis]